MKNKTLHKINNKYNRETKILNIICNTTILLMSIMTESLTNMITKMTKEMTSAITKGISAQANTIKEIHEETDYIENDLTKQILEQLLEIKVDITKQIKEKKEKFETIISDKRFDKGIEIVESYNFHLPNISCDLNEHNLLRYFVLLQENNEKFAKMFQELIEWMKNLPQP